MSGLIVIENDGQEIKHTNYWETEHADRGLMYLSVNAGVLRLLVPAGQVAAGVIDEIRTGTRAELVPTIRPQLRRSHLDLVFEDGSPSPYSISIDRQQVDIIPHNGNNKRLLVYTEAGLVLELPCRVKL